MAALYTNPSALGKAIAQKKREIYGRHGGVLSPTDLSRELGFGDRRDAERWAREHDVPPIQMGPRKRGYEADLLARAMVQARGMCG